MFAPELRHQTEDELAKLEGVRYQVDLFSGVTHGFAVGDIKIQLSDMPKGFGRSIGIFQECSSFGPLIIEMFMVSKM